MNRRDFLKRLGLLPLALRFLKLPEGEKLETTLPPIEPDQKLDVESMFSMSNPSPYFSSDDVASFYRALADSEGKQK